MNTNMSPLELVNQQIHDWLVKTSTAVSANTFSHPQSKLSAKDRERLAEFILLHVDCSLTDDRKYPDGSRKYKKLLTQELAELANSTPFINDQGLYTLATTPGFAWLLDPSITVGFPVNPPLESNATKLTVPEPTADNGEIVLSNAETVALQLELAAADARQAVCFPVPPESKGCIVEIEEYELSTFELARINNALGRLNTYSPEIMKAIDDLVKLAESQK